MTENIFSGIDLYRLIFDNSPEAIVLLDMTGRMMAANGRLYDWLGTRPDEVIGKNVVNMHFLPIKSKAIVAQKMAARLSGQEVKAYDLEFLDSNGQIKIGRVIGTEIKSKEGKTIGDLVMISEVTEIKKAQDKQLKKEKTLEALNFAAEKFLSGSDWEVNISEILKRIGEASEVSRVYIFENNRSEGGSAFVSSQKYEWVNSGIKAEIGNKKLQNVDLKSSGFERWMHILGKGDIVSGNVSEFPKSEQEFLESQDIKSILVVPIHVSSVFWGFIGFDECVNEKIWTAEEEDVLGLAAKLLGSAISLQNANKILKAKKEEFENLNKIMVDREIKMIELKDKLKKYENF